MSMSLRLRRLVRTPYSEQLTLYRTDESSEPISVGKVDLHFTSDGVFGTLLVWDEELLSWDHDELEDFLRGLIEDLVEPQGMADVYAVECFITNLDTYRFLTNSEEEGEEEIEEGPVVMDTVEEDMEKDFEEEYTFEGEEMEETMEEIVVEEDE